MEIAEHIAAINRDGDLLAAAAQQAGLDAEVPSCQPWQVRDLLRHLGYVHRWAASYVADQRTDRVPRLTEAELLAAGPADTDLISWFQAGCAALVSTLRAADPEVKCWTFLDAPSPVAFWTRRQAHETAIHRVDAELAAGQLSSIPVGFAADGIDELLMGFFGRNTAEMTDAQRSAARRSVQVRTTDTHGQWLVDLTDDGRLATSVQRARGRADCTVEGPAEWLYLLLWNRVEPDAAGIDVSGDSAIWRAWRDDMRVTWA
jgi:uncharacterized protein (TIGR03083 family)